LILLTTEIFFLGPPAVQWFDEVVSTKRHTAYAFECDYLYSDIDFYSMVGFSKAEFRSVLPYLGDMRSSHGRSKENALGMFFMKLRHNTTQEVFIIYVIFFSIFNFGDQ